MKKSKILLSCALTLASFLAIGAESAYADTTYTAVPNVPATGIEKLEYGRTAKIELPDDPYDKYFWTYFIKNTSIAQVIKEENVMPNSAGLMSSADSKYKLTIRGLKEGTTYISFNYRKVGGGRDLRTVTYIIKVDSRFNAYVIKQDAPITGSVSLRCNPSTGHWWKYSIGDNTVSDVTSKTFVSDDPTGQLIGVGGTYTWKFKGLRPGTTQVTFYYFKAAAVQPEKFIVYNIEVDPNLNVTISSLRDQVIDEEIDHDPNI